MKMPPLTAVIAVDSDAFAKMVRFYADSASANPSEYVEFFAKGEDFSLTIYREDKHGMRKAVFQGFQALHEARIWDKDATASSFKDPRGEAKRKRMPINMYPQIGSDEVGTGDFFGPVIVVAAYVEEKDLPLLEELGVTDSKMMDDERILEIGPRLINGFLYSELCLMPEKYNEVVRSNNMNEIKAKMHNRALSNLKAKKPSSTPYIDQFAEESLYYKYLRNEPNVLQGIRFSTKGETAFPSVALASVIARYAFLRKMQKLSEEYGVSFPFGAGAKVESFAASFLEREGKEKLGKVAKLNFKTYTKLL